MNHRNCMINHIYCIYFIILSCIPLQLQGWIVENHTHDCLEVTLNTSRDKISYNIDVWRNSSKYREKNIFHKITRLQVTNLLSHREKECRIGPFLQFAEALWSQTWPFCNEHVLLLPRPSASRLPLTVLSRWMHHPSLAIACVATFLLIYLWVPKYITFVP